MQTFVASIVATSCFGLNDFVSSSDFEDPYPKPADLGRLVHVRRILSKRTFRQCFGCTVGLAELKRSLQTKISPPALFLGLKSPM